MRPTRVAVLVCCFACLVVCAHAWSQKKKHGSKPRESSIYLLTIYAELGANSAANTSQSAEESRSNMGHVFIELGHDEKKAILGFYPVSKDKTRGEWRVNADLVQTNAWTVKQTYQITAQGYEDAHKMIDSWHQTGQSWHLWCNCGDFAEAIARAAGLDVSDLSKLVGVFDTPTLWARYLYEHNGPLNSAQVPESCSFLVGYAEGAFSSCMHLCNFGGPDAACQAGCQSQNAKNIAWEKREMANCIRQHQGSKLDGLVSP